MAGNNQQAPISPVVTIPGYKIMEVLGKGGMAIVYLATQESIGRQVALKILAPDHTDETFSERFLREARIISQLAHPNIVTIYDAGVHQGYHYMCMEYISGKNLTQARDDLTRKQKIAIIKQIALALEFAAQKGYVHRDIKPENIMLHEDGRAILTDFGIARGQDVSRGLTQTGKAIGTPYFMSPEQTKGLEVDHRSDIYSLGIVLFQSVSGHVPFDGTSLVDIGIKHISAPIPPLPPGMEIFQPIINKCMSKDPAHRYQSAQELYQALEAIPEAQLDFMEAKAKAQKQVPVSHEMRTMADQPSIEILANSAAHPAQLSQSVPKMRAHRVNDSVDITNTKEFRQLRRRHRSAIWLIVMMVLAGVGYWQQGVLRQIWQQQVRPMLAAYLPATPSPNPPNTPAQGTNQAQLTPPSTETLTTEPDPVNAPDITIANGTDKTADSVIADIQRDRNKLQMDPGDAEARTGIEEARRWFHDKLERAIKHKDADAARQYLSALNRGFPRASRLPAIKSLEHQIATLEQFNTHLQKARVYMAANAIAKPAGANALEEYQAAAHIDANDPNLKQGLQSIAQHFYEKARTDQSAGKLADAVDDVANGLLAVPQDTKLLALKQELDTGIQQAQQVSQQLQQADTLMRKNQVIDPPSDNAYLRYRQIQDRDPNNLAAKEGLRQVRLWLISHIQALLDKKQYLPARDLLKRAEAAFPGSQAFAPLRNKTEQAIDAIYPKVTHIEFAAAPIRMLSGHTQIDKLAPGQTLYAGFSFKNFYEDKTSLIARLKDSQGQQLYDERGLQVSGRQGTGAFALQLPNPGSPDGGYTVELYMNNAQILKARLSGLQ